MILLASAIVAAMPAAASEFVHDRRLTRFAVGLADLNGDGQAEALVYAMDASGGGEADLCGSGGCNLYVLSLTRKRYRVVADISLTRPPIRVLATKTRGWRDLAVHVAGGGIMPGYEARLRFDGRTYPENPTGSPATRVKRDSGKVVIRSVPSLRER